MKVIEFEITKTELCIIISEWCLKHHGDQMKVDVEAFDSDQLETISFRTVDS